MFSEQLQRYWPAILVLFVGGLLTGWIGITNNSLAAAGWAGGFTGVLTGVVIGAINARQESRTSLPAASKRRRRR